MTEESKVRENRVRRAAERQQCYLRKSRRRDVKAWDYGTCMLISWDNNVAILQDASFDDVQDWLDHPSQRQPSSLSRIQHTEAR